MMDRFQQEAPSGNRITDVVSFWVSRLAEPQWRDLARMALDYLTMSAEPERVFLAVRRSRCQTAGVGWEMMLSKLWSAYRLAEIWADCWDTGGH